MPNPNSSEQLHFTFPPRSNRGSIMGFTWGQIGMTVAGVLCLVIGFNLATGSHVLGAVAMVALAVILFVLGLVRIAGRRVTEWLPIFIGATAQRISRQDRYRGAAFAPNPGFADAQLDLPGPLAGYTWLPAIAADGRTVIGMLHHRADKTVTAVLSCSGANFMLTDTSVQENRLVAWADACNSLGIEYAERGLKRWSLMVRSVADTGNRAQRYLINNAVETDSAAFKSLAELTAAAAPSGQRHEVFFVAVFDRSKLGRDIKDAGGTDAAVAAVVLEQLFGIEATIADAGITTNGWLTPRGLAGVMRTQFDPADQPAVDLRGNPRPGVNGGIDAGVDPLLAGPAGAETVGWTHYRHDSAVSQTLWVREMPRQPVGMTWLTPLFTQTSCRRTVTLIADPVPAHLASLASRRDKVKFAGDEQTKKKLRLVTTARETEEAKAVEAVDREQAAGHVRYRYCLLVTVTSSDEEQLKRDVLQVKRKLARSRCEAVTLFGEQDQAFYAGALPLGRGLAPMRGVLAS